MLAPSFENSRANALPIPSEEPVINMVLLNTLIFITLELVRLSLWDDWLLKYYYHGH